MSALLDKVTALLTEAEVEYDLHCEEGQEIIHLGQVNKEMSYHLLIQVDDAASIVHVIGAANCYVPEDKRAEAYVLLNESNYSYPLKSYIDPRDGQLMAQKSPDVDGDALNKEVLMAAIAAVHAAIEHNYDAMMRLRYGN